MNNCLKFIQQRLWPALCVTCGQRAEAAVDLCQGCLEAMPYLKVACRRCGLPLAQAGYCGGCLKTPPPFEQTFSLFRYAYPVDHLIQQLKFNRRLVNARLLAALMSEALQQRGQRLPDVMVPVPLYQRRLQQRSYNQAQELARPVSKQLGVRMDFACCRRVRETAVQSDLPASERRDNIKGAFEVSSALAGQHVVIIDDVMTTGNTVAELAQAMRARGARIVDIWVCARVL